MIDNDLDQPDDVLKQDILGSDQPEFVGYLNTDEGRQRFPHGRYRQNCMICGAEKPSGHALVYGEDDQPVGRVCSKHTIKELTQTDILVRLVKADE